MSEVTITEYYVVSGNVLANIMTEVNDLLRKSKEGTFWECLGHLVVTETGTRFHQTMVKKETNSCNLV